MDYNQSNAQLSFCFTVFAKKSRRRRSRSEGMRRLFWSILLVLSCLANTFHPLLSKAASGFAHWDPVQFLCRLASCNHLQKQLFSWLTTVLTSAEVYKVQHLNLLKDLNVKIALWTESSHRSSHWKDAVLAHKVRRLAHSNDPMSRLFETNKRSNGA